MDIKFGDPRMESRFWDKVVENHETGCWEWVRAKSNGYGQYGLAKGEPKRTRAAHRLAFIRLRFDPGELVCDHLCRNRSCVNPTHLRAVTHAVNILAGISFSAENARKTHCPKGHEYTMENTIVRRNGSGRNCRNCKTCENVAPRIYTARRSGHGTAGKYRSGCRCRDCKDHQRDRIRVYRANRNAAKINLAPGIATRRRMETAGESGQIAL